jgi:hypothetical protein
MFLTPLRWMYIGMNKRKGYMFSFGNLLRREGIPKRVFKFNKFSKDYLLKLFHLRHEFLASPTWGSGLDVV